MRKRILLSVAASLLAMSGCSKEAPKEAEPIVPVQVTPVRQDSIRRIVTADGVLFARDWSNVMPKISAPVRKFYVNRGDHVTQGQLVAELESSDLRAAAAESKGQVDQAEANYRSTAGATVPEEVSKAQADVQAAKQAADAAQKLLENREKLLREGALARKLVDDAQVAYAQAKSQYETAQSHLKALQSVGKQEQIVGAAAQVEAAKGHQQSAQAQVGYAQIHSPIAGVISDRPVYPGEMANAGAPLFTVMDISSVSAHANIPQTEAAYLKVGNAATLTQIGTDVEIAGKVTMVSPAVDPNSTTVQVWVAAANPGERLKPGASVRVSIVAATIPNAVVVPSAAILPSSEGGTSVIVAGSDSVAHEKKVQVGIREPDKVQILSGVSAGEPVVIVGGVGLQDGTKVRVEKPGEKKAEDADEKPAGKGKSEEK
jgi:multidrug efflux pump subunit AcrA (membrane-fusion protein)